MIDKGVLTDFLQTTFPNECIKYLGEGWTSIAFQVDDKIVRIPREHPGKYIKESVVCNVIRDLISFSVPCIFVNKNVEFPYAIHKKLDGRTWNMNYVRGLDEKAQMSLADDCVDFLSQIHGLDADKVNSKTKLENVDLYYEEFGPRDFAELEYYLKSFFTANDLMILAKKYDEALNFNVVDKVFCHGDFNGNNCVLDKNDRLAGVFDWGNCGIGERTKDFMRLFFSDSGKEFFNIVSQKYEQKTGVHIDENRLHQLNMVETVNLVYWLNVQESLHAIKESDLEAWVIPAIGNFISG